MEGKHRESISGRRLAELEPDAGLDLTTPRSPPEPKPRVRRVTDGGSHTPSRARFGFIRASLQGLQTAARPHVPTWSSLCVSMSRSPLLSCCAGPVTGL